MEFVKYRSLENTYRSKFIASFLNQFPELATAQYQITEKIHGANVSVSFVPGQPWKLGKRTSFLQAGENFYNIWEVVENYREYLDGLQELVEHDSVTMTLYGELYGPKVQKGVNYGATRRIAFFDLVIDGEMLPPIDFTRAFQDHADLTVPIIDIVDGLEAALGYDVEFNSHINPEEGNICEGIVIKPLRQVYYDKRGCWFCLKKKNEKFGQKVKEKKVSPEDPELARLNVAFRNYLTDNRLQGVFSKYGEIEEPEQIGQYIRWMLADAQSDFEKDYEEVSALDKNDQRKVFNVGGTIANMLKGKL